MTIRAKGTLFAALILLGCLAQSADAQGILQRLLGRQRAPCVPALPPTVQIEANVPSSGKVREPWSTLEGRVVFKGDLPNIENLQPRVRQHVDMLHLLKGPKDELHAPTWRIDPKTRGIANVAVFIKRPKDGMLPIHPDDKNRKDSVVIDMPFAAFLPHVVAFYPEWYDGKKRAQTGQKLIFKNSSPLARNVRATGHPEHNPGFNRSLPPGTQYQPSFNPQLMPVSAQNDVHNWMHAYVWVFDHPYYAITKADGTFTIPRVPVGMEVQVVAWHEGVGWVFGGKNGKNVLDFEISAN
ncbi:MAG: hypothetical protein EXR98_14445 [Gemmataceae bacterium]|nr:hypothetical protein [Gemmataceae bacterium]